MRVLILSITFLTLAVNTLYARFYSSVSQWFEFNGCQVFLVEVYDDNGTSEPIDDILVATGALSNCKGAVDTNGLFPQTNDISAIRIPSGNATEMNEDLKVYPNPANEMLTIEIGPNATSAFVTNLVGGVSESIDISNRRDGQIVHSISNLAPGIYIIHVHEEDLVRCSRVVVE